MQKPHSSQLLREISNQLKLKTVKTFLLDNIVRFRTAITGAIKYRKSQELPEEQKIELLRQDILGGPKHVMGNHEECEVNGKYFCKGRKSGEKNLHNLFVEVQDLTYLLQQ